MLAARLMRCDEISLTQVRGGLCRLRQESAAPSHQAPWKVSDPHPPRQHRDHNGGAHPAWMGEAARVSHWQGCQRKVLNEICIA